MNSRAAANALTLRIPTVVGDMNANTIAVHMTEIVDQLSGKQASIMVKALWKLQFQNDAGQTAIAALTKKAGQDQPAQFS